MNAAGSRLLTDAERNLAASMFGSAIDYDSVRIHRGKWWPFQPRQVAMAPRGSIWLHPAGDLWCDDFCARDLGAQALFIHEMTHVWQHQRGVFLPLARHPFCRYRYRLIPGRPLELYGIEQQAEIVKHAFLLREGAMVGGAPDVQQYAAVLPFRGHPL